MSISDDYISSLRAIPPGELQRSQREFLAAMESTAFLLEHFGPGKNPSAVSPELTVEIALRVMEALFTTRGPWPPPPGLFDEYGPEPLIHAMDSFCDRMRDVVQAGQTRWIISEGALDAALMLNDILMNERREDPDYLSKALKLSVLCFEILIGMLQRGAHADATAELRAAWPDTSLSLEDLVACAHYAVGKIELQQGEIDYAAWNFTEAACLGRGLAWRVLADGLPDLMKRGSCATAASMARDMLETCRAQGSDPLRVAWLSSLAAVAGAFAGDWDPWEAQDLLREAVESRNKSMVLRWAGFSFNSLEFRLLGLRALAEAGVGVASATGCRRLGPLHIWLNKESLPIQCTEVARRAICCDVCGGRGESGTRLCGGCHVARYCGQRCQREGWMAHKEACRKVKEIVGGLTVNFEYFLW